MADKRITDYADSGVLDGTELAELVKAGANVRTPARRFVPPVVGDNSTALTALPAHAGIYRRWTNAAAKTWTFDGTQAYEVGSEFHARNVGAANLTLAVAGGFVLNAPYNGTLVVPGGGTVTVKIVAAGVGDVFGVTS
jgi:hypothetical protein